MNDWVVEVYCPMHDGLINVIEDLTEEGAWRMEDEWDKVADRKDDFCEGCQVLGVGFAMHKDERGV